MSIIASHLRSRDTGLVIWIATTRELLEQAATEFEATWGVVGDRPISCVRLWSSYDVNIEDGIIVAGASKAALLRKGQGASVGSRRPKIRPQPYGPPSPVTITAGGGIGWRRVAV